MDKSEEESIEWCLSTDGTPDFFYNRNTELDPQCLADRMRGLFVLIEDDLVTRPAITLTSIKLDRQSLSGDYLLCVSTLVALVNTGETRALTSAYNVSRKLITATTHGTTSREVILHSIRKNIGEVLLNTQRLTCNECGKTVSDIFTDGVCGMCIK